MAFLISLFFLLATSGNLAGALSRSHFREVLESSGTGPDEPVRGSVRVVKISPHFLRRSAAHHVPTKSLSSRSAFPAFLARGRAGSSAFSRSNPAVLIPQVSSPGADRKRHGVEMWQKVMQKSERSKVALSPKHLTKSCGAVAFTQRVTEDGCETVTVQNHLCFGHCTSMFVPISGESRGHAPCTRCGPATSRTVLVPLRCAAEVRQKRVMVVEECKCETSAEEVKGQRPGMSHL